VQKSTNYESKKLDNFSSKITKTEEQRNNDLRMKARQIQNRAEREDNFIKLSTGHSKADIEKSLAVNDMYIEAIQAKLKMLDNI